MAETEAVISRRGIIAAVVLAALASFYYLYEVRGGRQREARAAEEKKVFRLADAEVQDIKLVRPGEEIRLQRTAEGWALKAPLEAPADDAAVESLLTSLTGTRIEERVGPQDDLGEFGLDDPAVEVELAGTGPEEGEWRQRLRLGAESPISSDSYALLGDDPEVVLVSSGVRQAAEKQVLDLRDRKLVELQSWKVDRLELQRGEESLAFRKENGHWHLERPFRTPADDGTLGDLISHLGRLEAKAFPAEEPDDLETFGLADPPIRVVIHQEDWKEPRRFEFGGAGEQGNRYARRLDRPSVMEVEEAIWPKLNQPLAEMRRAVLFEAGRWNVARVDLEDATGSLSVQKSGEGEWRAGPEGGPAVPVEGLLDALEDLRASGFRDREVADPSRFALDRPRLRAVVWTKSDLEVDPNLEGESSPGEGPSPPRPFELLVGGSAGSEETFVKDARWPTVFRVPSDQVAELEAQIGTLRESLAAEPSGPSPGNDEPEGGSGEAAGDGVQGAGDGSGPIP